jgi:dUTP pyrophosphatase
MLNNIAYAKLTATAKSPMRKNPTDAGLDFYADEDKFICPGCVEVVKTGISIEVPEGYVLMLKAKSRSNFIVGAGVIDAYYQPGEILVKIFNPLKMPLTIEKGTAVCQGLFIKIETPLLVECAVESLTSPSLRSMVGGIVEGIL